MDNVFTFETEKALVRIHPGKRTEAEQREAWEKAAREFYKAIQKEMQKNEKNCN